MTIYCYVLLGLHAMIVGAAIEKATTTDREVTTLEVLKPLMGVFLYLPIIGRVLGWW